MHLMELQVPSPASYARSCNHAARQPGRRSRPVFNAEFLIGTPAAIQVLALGPGDTTLQTQVGACARVAADMHVLRLAKAVFRGARERTFCRVAPALSAFSEVAGSRLVELTYT